MPFTTMGTKSFVFGKTMENLDADFEYESYDNPTADDGLGYMQLTVQLQTGSYCGTVHKEESNDRKYGTW